MAFGLCIYVMALSMVLWDSSVKLLSYLLNLVGHYIFLCHLGFFLWIFFCVHVSVKTAITCNFRAVLNYAFWKWPVRPETCKGIKISCLIYVTLDGTLIKIIMRFIQFCNKWNEYNFHLYKTSLSRLQNSFHTRCQIRLWVEYLLFYPSNKLENKRVLSSWT
jgi:hypothetical protein